MSITNPAAFNVVSSGKVAPMSVGAICAARSDARPRACAGARANEKYTIAATSGGKAAPRPPM